MNNVKLSVIIPTYNSEDVISYNLDSLLPQVQSHKDVELIICNNCSSDNTREVIEQYRYKYENLIRVIDRPESIPSQQNFFQGVNEASGEYIFLLGDDDILVDRFLDIILPKLYGKNSIIHFNRIEGLSDFKESRLFNRKIQSATNWHHYNSSCDYLIDHAFECNFMSSIIFKRDVWQRGLKHVSFDKPYYGYYWYAVLLFGSVNCEFEYCNFPLVLQRVRNHTWGKSWCLFSIVGMYNIYRDLDQYVEGIYSIFYKMDHDFRLNTFYSKLGSLIPHRSFYRQYRVLFKSVLTKKEFLLFNIFCYGPVAISKVLNKIALVLTKDTY